MQKQFYALLLTALILLASCSKNGSPVTPQPTVPKITGVTPSGPKNTIITISGTNFITNLAQIQVKVNGKTCSVLTATATSITAQIPPACGTGIVELFFNGTRYAGPVFNFINTYTLTSITNGIVGYADGPLATAQFEQINGLAIDANDNIYIPQYDNPRIRKISAAGIASNLAGNGTGGYVDAQGTNARFFLMDYGSTDQAGNLYVADKAQNTVLHTNKIRKVDVNGNVTTVAIVPHHLTGIKVGKLGNIYVCGSDAISKYTSSGTLVWSLRSHGPGNVDGDTSIVQFNLFGGIEVDDTETNIYVSSQILGSQLKKLNLTTKTMTTIAGDGTIGHVGSGPALSCKFRLISSSVLDNSGGIYFTDFYNNNICYLKDGNVTTIITGVYGSVLDVDGDASVGRIAGSLGITLDSHGQLFIGCLKNNKIKKLVID